jgi:hypothetical protein
MLSDDLDPTRAFRESMAAQRSVLTAASQLTTGTSVVRDMLAVQNSFQVFNQWRALTGTSDLHRSIRAVSELNERLSGWSKAVTAMNTALPDISALRFALSIPTGELRLLAEVPAADLDDDAKQSLADVATVVNEEDQPGSPPLLSDWLDWLPSHAQIRLLLLVLVALNALIEYADAETGVEPPDHLTTLICALAAVAAALNEYVAKRQ